MKRLIVTADDVGLHEAMNRGAIEAHRQGIVTACSVVANGRAFDHAIDALLHLSSLEVGVHLTLVEESPLTPPERVPSLLTRRGTFLSSHVAFARRYYLGAIGIADVERELRAQIERVLHTGIRVAHINGHQHLHLLPRIFELVQRLAREYRIGYVRVVDDRGGRGSLLRRASIALLSAYGRKARHMATVATNVDTIGVTEAGHLSARRIVSLLQETGAATELVCHPAIADDDARRRYRWGYDWAAELEALCSNEVAAALGGQSIQLVRPSDVAHFAE